MNLDEAIKHCEEVAKSKTKQVENGDWEKDSSTERDCIACASEHRQLAEWLKELKAYKEQGGDAISRKYILDLITTKGANLDDDLLIVEQWIQDAPSVNPHPIECGDAISRQAVLELCDVRWLDDFAAEVRALPSVTPQQKIGRWIQKEEEGEAEPFIIWECSECHCVNEDGKPSYKYCPQCGAKMEVEADD